MSRSEAPGTLSRLGNETIMLVSTISAQVERHARHTLVTCRTLGEAKIGAAAEGGGQRDRRKGQGEGGSHGDRDRQFGTLAAHAMGCVLCRIDLSTSVVVRC